MAIHNIERCGDGYRTSLLILVNPRCACAARVTVVAVSVCLSVCVCLSHLTSGASVRPENYLGNEGQNICGVFSEIMLFQSYGTSCIVWLDTFECPFY